MKKNIYNSINEVLIEIKKSKKYNAIANGIIISEIKKYLKSNQILKITQISKQDLKNIKTKLHKLYSSYQTKKKNKRNQYLEELNILIKTKRSISEVTKKLLSITLSTKERLGDYEKIYKNIFKITGKPKKIIDLGGGLNSFSIPLMNLKKINYYSYDINNNDKDFLNKYFNIIKTKTIKGFARILDIRDLKKVKNLPKSDITFMFKVIDLIKDKNKKITEELIKNINL